MDRGIQMDSFDMETNGQEGCRGIRGIQRTNGETED